MVEYGYIRVSKGSDNQAHNLDSQRDALQTYGIPRRMIFEDVASGARFSGRDGWDELKSYLQSGDNITVTHLDRFSRNLREGLDTLRELGERDIGIYVLSTGFDTRSGSAASTLMRNIVLAFAEWQYSDTRERVLAGMESARRQGRHPGRPTTKTPENVETVLALRQAGYSNRDIARRSNVGRSTVDSIIKDHLARE